MVSRFTHRKLRTTRSRTLSGHCLQEQVHQISTGSLGANQVPVCRTMPVTRQHPTTNWHLQNLRHGPKRYSLLFARRSVIRLHSFYKTILRIPFPGFVVHEVESKGAGCVVILRFFNSQLSLKKISLMRALLAILLIALNCNIARANHNWSRENFFVSRSDLDQSNRNELIITIPSLENEQRNQTMELVANADLLHPQFYVQNPTSPVPLQNCYYHGLLRGEEGSEIVANICGLNLRAHISYRGREFEIQPLLLSDSGTYRIVEGFSRSDPIQVGKLKMLEQRLHKREFSNPNAYLELLVVNDYNRAQNLGRRLESNTLDLANMVSNRYWQDLGVRVVVTGIHNAPQGSFLPGNVRPQAQDLLESLIDYKRRNTLPHHDHALLLTSRDIYNDADSHNTGLSRVGSVCREDSVSVVQALKTHSSSSIAATMSHEIGHALDMPHDGSDQAKGCRNGIMESITCTNCKGTSNLRFSQCSKHIGGRFIRMADCLKNRPALAIRCGNGRVDTLEGEECDEDSPCCDRNTCRFKKSKCSLDSGNDGMCLLGKCVNTCGNGQLESHEECEPKLLTNGCCDSKTCKFQPAMTLCNDGKAVCDGTNRCATGLAGLLQPPMLQVRNDSLLAYTIEEAGSGSNKTANSTVVYTIDGTTPTLNGTSSRILSGLITITFSDALAAVSSTTSSPMMISVDLKARAFHPAFASSHDFVHQLFFVQPEVDTVVTQPSSSADHPKLSHGAQACIAILVVAVITIAAFSIVRHFKPEALTLARQYITGQKKPSGINRGSELSFFSVYVRRPSISIGEGRAKLPHIMTSIPRTDSLYVPSSLEDRSSSTSPLSANTVKSRQSVLHSVAT
eukprot:Partr_v1_DN28984_c1_g1_i2_m25960 putative ADAM metallopeptidase domain